MKRRTLGLLALPFVLAGITFYAATHFNVNPKHSVGDKLDEFHGVAVYYNGAINHTAGRNTTLDGYNLGLRYQCVEFVKRYYHDRFGHKMPNTMGHAKDFFSPTVADGALNKDRMLLQYRNGGGSTPAAEDLIVFSPWLFNRYGHVAIVSEVGQDFIEVVQQNPGPFGDTRERFPLVRSGGLAKVDHPRAMGWLRPPPDSPAPATTPNTAAQR